LSDNRFENEKIKLTPNRIQFSWNWLFWRYRKSIIHYWAFWHVSRCIKCKKR